MRIKELVKQLVGSDKNAASDALVAMGEPAVRPVLDVLCDENSPIDWGTSATVLRRIGLPALAPLVEAMAAAPTDEVARRCGWAHSGLRIDDLAVFVPYLRHPSPTVRANTAFVLQNKEAAALPYAPDLFDLLDDPDSHVRWRARCALAYLGPDVLPPLRELRRSGASGRIRRRVRDALDAIAGPSEMDERDQAAVRRLIRIRQAAEKPEPMHLSGTWYAIPTGDRQAVLEAFDLSDAEPVTMKAGTAGWNYDEANNLSYARVYVTPSLNGWTLVFGRPFDTDGPDRCRDLSRHFGTAYWYGTDCYDEWLVWCVAENGEVVGNHNPEEPDEEIGPEPDHYTIAFATRDTVDPSELGPETPFRGHGFLALTFWGREHGHPRGVLEF